MQEGPGSIPGSGSSPGEGIGYPLQYSCPENFMNRRAWQATDHGATESDTAEHIRTHAFMCNSFYHLSLTTFLLSPFTAFPYFLLLLPPLPTQTDTKRPRAGRNGGG